VPRALGDSLDCPGIPGMTINDARLRLTDTTTRCPVYSENELIVTRPRGSTFEDPGSSRRTSPTPSIPSNRPPYRLPTNRRDRRGPLVERARGR
jgi:hypothetical protein